MQSQSRRALATRASTRATERELTAEEQEWEGVLEEMESEKLYGLGSKETELSQFCSWLEKGKLNLFPEYQREYVWKPDKASRLIATALCNRYVPPVVLHEREKGCYDVVDGKQRLTSLLGFYLNGQDNVPPRLMVDTRFKEKMDKILPDLRCLSKLDESYEKLNGLSYAALSDERKEAYQSYSITYVVIPLKTPKTDVFEVYEDINSGGEDLKPQQVRRAVYYGPYIELLDDLAEDCENFKVVRDAAAVHNQVYEQCPTHSDRELILRALAFRTAGGQYKAPLKKFLNRELEGTDEFENRDREDKERINARLADLRAEFEAVMKVARDVFEDHAFRKWAPGRSQDKQYVWSKSIAPSLWDAGYLALAELLKEFKPAQFLEAKREIVNALKESYEHGFFAQDTAGITDKKFLARKDELKRLFRAAIEEGSHARDSRRAFSPQMRQPLFEQQGGMCPICTQAIDPMRIEDPKHVEIDHKTPHSLGGPTTSENAQLVHRECNRKKGANMG